MIIFHTIKWQNFLSAGNNPIEVRLDQHAHTLVVGSNGAGKSTMLDALSYALFGRPHRNINKPQICNSINRKKCLVEVTFSTNGFQYLIKRGLKPNIFEIWKNGVLINQNSHNKEYQKILEQNILKLNHKSFHQIVVLGSSSFVPFMALASQNRRDVIEDLLDINVFSKMNSLLKEKTALVRDQIRELEYKIDIDNAKLTAVKDSLRILESRNVANLESKEAERQSFVKELDETNAEIERLSNGLTEKIQELNGSKLLFNETHRKLMASKQKCEHELSGLLKHIKFLEKNDVCPTCNQDIDPEFKEKEVLNSKGLGGTKATDVQNMNTQISGLVTLIEGVQNDIQATVQDQTTIHGHNNTVMMLDRAIAALDREIEELSKGSADTKVARNTIKTLEKDVKKWSKEKNDLSDVASYQRVSAELLKDSGIKTKIIKQYLPVINKLVNQYLQVLDFFVHFNLDESFKETIRSRHRDDFTYDSFSEGEKQRIDLSLLFTWRAVAKMKNSVVTNLLVLDETFDSSLDADGVENLLKILYTLDAGTNVFIISHKTEVLDGKFEHKLEFTKKNNFSVLV